MHKSPCQLRLRPTQAPPQKQPVLMSWSILSEAAFSVFK